MELAITRLAIIHTKKYVVAIEHNFRILLKLIVGFFSINEP